MSIKVNVVITVTILQYHTGLSTPIFSLTTNQVHFNAKHQHLCIITLLQYTSKMQGKISRYDEAKLQQFMASC